MNKLKILSTALKYYNRSEIQEAIVREALHREVGMRYIDGFFGKRPDVLMSTREVIEFVKQKVVSFHFSEELWRDPLTIDSYSKNLDENRIGWDLIIDVDGINFELSKIATKWYLRLLQNYDLTPSLKFSGNKGFHIAIPFEHFPKEVYGKPISSLFPDAPKKIASYLSEKVKTQISNDLLRNYDIKDLVQIVKKPKNEIIQQDTLNLSYFIEIDTVLVSSRHLFRAPYSLHEKSNLVSVPIRLNKFKKFEREDAQPDQIDASLWFIKRESLGVPIGVAKRLFVEVFDYFSKANILEVNNKIKKRPSGYEFYDTSFENLTPNNTKYNIILTNKIKENLNSFMPPCIKNIEKGLKDGRKRSLFIYLNLLHSLGFKREEIEEIIYSWNEKNSEPLKESYVKGQLKYFLNREPLMPPNCDRNEFYKDIGICEPDSFCKFIKNPLTYAVKRISRTNEMYRLQTKKTNKKGKSSTSSEKKKLKKKNEK